MEGDKKARMVPEKDLIAIKQILRDKEKKWETERSQFTSRIGQLENEVRITKANGEDSDDVARVKQMLIDQAEEIKTNRTKLDEDLNSHSKREREFRARELATELKGKGVEIESESLLDTEDMERHAKDLLVEFQAKEIERLKTQPNTPESVFEHGAGGVVKKDVWAMTDAEFKDLEKNLQAKALSAK